MRFTVTLTRIASLLFAFEGWEYLLSKPFNRPLDRHIVWCRMKGHPNGIVFYRSNGDCPDTRCRDCGEDIG